MHEDKEFYKCEDEDNADDKCYDTRDAQDNELPPLIPRGTKETKFLPPLNNYMHNGEKVGMKREEKEGMFKDIFGDKKEIYTRFKKWASNH